MQVFLDAFAVSGFTEALTGIEISPQLGNHRKL